MKRHLRHCKKLTPEFEKAAQELKGKVSLGKVDATGGRFHAVHIVIGPSKKQQIIANAVCLSPSRNVWLLQKYRFGKGEGRFDIPEHRNTF